MDIIKPAKHEMFSYMLLAAMVVAIAYTATDIKKPNHGISEQHLDIITGHGNGVEYALALAVLILNAIVGIVIVSKIFGFALSNQAVSMNFKMGLSLSTLVIMAAVALNISNVVVPRDEKGDALGIAALSMSSLAILPVVIMLALSLKQRIK